MLLVVTTGHVPITLFLTISFIALTLKRNRWFKIKLCIDNILDFDMSITTHILANTKIKRKEDHLTSSEEFKLRI